MVDNSTLLHNLKKHLQEGYHDPIQDVILFGSQAKGTSDENSDYDILIVLGNDYTIRDENTIYDLCYDMDLKYNIIIDAHLITTRDLCSIRGKQPIITTALKTGIYA
jgi:predicted nucleotidyltransferase